MLTYFFEEHLEIQLKMTSLDFFQKFVNNILDRRNFQSDPLIATTLQIVM